MAAPGKSGSEYKNTEQVVLNTSRDDVYGVLAVETLVENSAQDALLRLNENMFSLGKLVPRNFDYIAVAYPTATTETYTYKNGGSGGTTVATITITYTDSTKENLSIVERM